MLSSYGVDPDDFQFVEKFLNGLPEIVRKKTLEKYRKIDAGLDTRRTRNIFLQDETELPREITNACRLVKDQHAVSKIHSILSSGSQKEIEALRDLVCSEKIKTAILHQSGDEDSIKRLSKKFTQKTSEKTIKRRLRVADRQGTALLNLHLKLIGKKENEICTPWQLEKRNRQKTAWQIALETTTISRGDDEFRLSEVSKNNKEKKFAEFYSIMKGMEKFAENEGCTWAFISLTCPPRMHSNPENGNCTWDGTSPKDGWKWMSSEFGKAKKRWEKKGMVSSGFWCSEPQKDATPHLHAMFFGGKSELEAMIKEIRKVPEWKSKIGCDVRWHDPNYVGMNGPAKASSYVSKYILKNLSTYEKLEGEAGACDEWRSTWNLRSFGFFGLPKLGTWRALRKTKERPEDELMGKMWDAVQAGEGYEFIRLSGGLGIKRDQRPVDGSIALLQCEKEVVLLNKETGEMNIERELKWKIETQKVIINK